MRAIRPKRLWREAIGKARNHRVQRHTSSRHVVASVTLFHVLPCHRASLGSIISASRPPATRLHQSLCRFRPKYLKAKFPFHMMFLFRINTLHINCLHPSDIICIGEHDLSKPYPRGAFPWSQDRANRRTPRPTLAVPNEPSPISGHSLLRRKPELLPTPRVRS